MYPESREQDELSAWGVAGFFALLAGLFTISVASVMEPETVRRATLFGLACLFVGCGGLLGSVLLARLGAWCGWDAESVEDAPLHTESEMSGDATLAINGSPEDDDGAVSESERASRQIIPFAELTQRNSTVSITRRYGRDQRAA